MEIAQRKGRIGILDGFRAISMLLVVLYHYFVRFTPPSEFVNYYPYGNVLADVTVFRYGFEGVDLFFIISGFVIYMTLEKCKGIMDFAIRRFIRLWPTLLICSLFTLAVLMLLPLKGFETEPKFLLSALTITNPRIWTKVFHFKSMGAIDGVIWSLICEVYFYAVASILFFTNRKVFLRNWIIYVLINQVMLIVLTHYKVDSVIYYLDITIFPRHLVYFTIGIYFYLLYSDQKVSKINQGVIVVMVLIQLLFIQNAGQNICTTAFILLFLVFIYKPSWLNFLTYRPIVIFGIISYPFYLIHQYAGMVMMNKFAILFHTNSMAGSVLPTFIVMVLVSYFIDKGVTLYVSPRLRSYLVKK